MRTALIIALAGLALGACDQQPQNIPGQTKQTVENVEDAINANQQRAVDAADEIMGRPRQPGDIVDTDGDGIPDDEDETPNGG